MHTSILELVDYNDDDYSDNAILRFNRKKTVASRF